VLRIAIVGSALAGFNAARALRRQSFNGEIVAIGAERHRPYDRPPLSKDFLTGACSVADLALADPDEELDVRWRFGTPAARLDPGNRRIVLEDGEEIRADGVIVATGARARRLPDAGGRANVHTLRTLDDAIALRAALRRGGRLVVIGAGFIGAEVASSARSLGLEVTVVEALPAPLAGPLGAEMGAVCARLHGDHGVRLRTGVPVARLIGTARADAVELADGTRLPADVVLVGIGARPNVEWLAGSGLAISGGGHRRGRGDQPAERRRHRRLCDVLQPARGPGDPLRALDPRVRAARDRGGDPAGRRGSAPAGPPGDPLLLVRPVRRTHPVRRAP
jgi:NADPH-dependent 2,4-dienoyl-CoA reductase/sulfur reductase-like enzyme